MSPAKRKRETRGRAPAAATAAAKRVPSKNRKGRSCGYEPAELEAACDAPDTRGEVLAHVPACEPCGDQLEVIAVQRDTLLFLGECEQSEVAEAARPVVRRLLDVTVAAGRKGLADLVYELAKACLLAADEFNVRLRRETEPRSFPSVRGEAARSMVRQGMKRSPYLPGRTPAANNVLLARRSARSCHRILVNVEGVSVRSRLFDGLLLLGEGRPEDAEARLAGVMDDSPDAVHRKYAWINYLWALIAQSRYSEAMASGGMAAREFPEEWAFPFNIAVAACYERDTRAVEKAAGEVRAFVGRVGDPRLVDLLQSQATKFAEELDYPENRVRELFGIDDRTARTKPR